MRKFFAVVRHEYKKIVVRWTFLIGTFLFPLLGIGFGIVPALIFSLKGEVTRIAIVDPSGEVLPRLRENLSEEAITARAREAAKQSMKDLSATQEERMKKGAR